MTMQSKFLMKLQKQKDEAQKEQIKREKKKLKKQSSQVVGANSTAQVQSGSEDEQPMVERYGSANEAEPVKIINKNPSITFEDINKTLTSQTFSRNDGTTSLRFSGSEVS